MTDEERKALVERLRINVPYEAPRCLEAADQIEADGQRIAELEAALVTEKLEAAKDFQTKLNDLANIGDAMFAMRRRIAELEAALVAASRQIVGLKDALAQAAAGDEE